MTEVLKELGINWRLLLSQALNFGILLSILTFFLYRPLLKILEERRKKIEIGVRAGEEAERRMAEIETLKKEKLLRVEEEAAQFLGEVQLESRKKQQEILKDASKKADTLLAEAKNTLKKQKEEILEKTIKEAEILIKSALIKTVELDPKHIDDKLIGEASAFLRKNKKYET